MVAKLIIGVLVAIVLVLLYRGMQQDEAAIDPTTPPDVKKILAVLHALHLSCDKVDSFTAFGKGRDGVSDIYLARCHNGGRYVYFQNLPRREVGAISCADESRRFGVQCPN
jgi:hypothetical protein